MNPINVLCATDDKYVPYCGIMLTSLFENNKDREVNAYIMIDKPLSRKSILNLKKVAEKYHQYIHYCLVDSTFFEKFPIKGAGAGHLSIVTYYRLYAADLLPMEVDKVLYLDCDIAVNASIGELFDMDWADYAIGAVSDMCVEWQEFYDRLQYDKSLGYFNAGVAFMNLDYWRKHNVAQQCFDYLVNNYDRMENNDQDVLNFVLKNQKRQLPISYNFQIQLLMPYFFDGYTKEMQEEIRMIQIPKIIHYAAELKPWMAYYYSYPFYSIWQRYKRLSPWRCMFEQLPKTRKLVALIKRYLLWPFGIKLKKPQLIEK